MDRTIAIAEIDGVLSMEAAVILKRLQVPPRRTIRVVLFTNEENGTARGRAYSMAHATEASHHIAVIETDSGKVSTKALG